MRFSDPAGEVAPIGAYSQLAFVPAGSETVHVSGQVGVDRGGRLVGPGVYEQTVQTFENIEALLAAEGMHASQLVKLLTFLHADADFGEFARARNEVYARWFPSGVFPAHSAAKVAALAQPALMVEIEGIAIR